MRRLLAVLSVSAAFPFVFPAGGQSYAAEGNKNADVKIQLTVERGCNLKFGGGGEISFGSFIDLKNPRYAEGSFGLACTQDYGGDSGSFVDINLDGGTADPNDKPSKRFLYYTDSAGKKYKMAFQVYQAKAGTDIWGDGTDGTKPYRVNIPARAIKVVDISFHAELFAQPLDGFSTGPYTNVLRATVKYGN